jgi:hypothetical protein
MSFFKLCSTALMTTALCVAALGFVTPTFAAVDGITENGATKTLEVPYYNATAQNQTSYVTVVINKSLNNLDSSEAFDVVSIDEQYNMQFTAPSTLSPVSDTLSRSINVSDAAFVGLDRSIRIVLTPASAANGGCYKAPNISGCAWDAQNTNAWEPKTFSCLSQPEGQCKASAGSFNDTDTNKLAPQKGGIYKIVIKPRANLIAQDYLFPIVAQSVQPNLSDPIVKEYTPQITTKGDASAPVDIDLTSPEIPDLDVTCINAYANTNDGICTFLLPAYRLLPRTFKMGIGDVIPAGECTAQGSKVTCIKVPVVNVLGLQPIFGQIGVETKMDTGEKANVIARPKNPLKPGQMLGLVCKEAVVNSVTTCNFSMPAETFLPDNFALSISDGKNTKECKANDLKVTCTNVPTGTIAGLVPIFEWYDAQKYDTTKKVNILPLNAPVAETGGAVDVVAFGSIIALLVGAGWYFFKGTRSKTDMGVSAIE